MVVVAFRVWVPSVLLSWLLLLWLLLLLLLLLLFVLVISRYPMALSLFAPPPPGVVSIVPPCAFPITT